MKTKLIYSNYDKETGLSVATIRTKHGEFTGYSKLHEEDYPIESSFAGCRYAEIKALCKSKKAEVKEMTAQIKILEDLEKEIKNIKKYNPYCMESRRLRRKIYELKAKRNDLKSKINIAQEMILQDGKHRASFLKSRKDG